MVILWWWVIPAVIVAALVAWLIGRHRREIGRPTSEPVWVANTSFLTRLKDYRRLMFRQRMLSGLAVMAALAAIITVSVVAARPMDKNVRYETTATRDVVLCLDVSGSMTQYDEQIVDTFIDIVDHFQGERIGMAIFNSTTRTVFPLTDDYDVVLDELDYARKIMSWGDGYGLSAAQTQEFIDYYTGTFGMDDQASLIGDGLASCAQLFDNQPTERSRTLILATDNQVNGTPLFTLPEATDVVMSRDAVLDGIYAASIYADLLADEERDEFKTEVERTSGLFYDAASPDLVPDIVSEITDQQIIDLDAEPEIEYTDHNTGAIMWSVVGVAGLLALAWRLRA